MKTRMQSIRAAAVTVAVGLMPPMLDSRPQQLPQQPPFTITISTVQDTFQKGAEINVKISLQNLSDKPVLGGKCAPHGDFDGFTVDVRDSHNETPRETHVLRLNRGEDSHGPADFTVPSGPSCESLPPNQISYSYFVATGLYEITRRGKYKIQVQRQDTYSGAIVKSNIITVTVTR